MLGAWAPTDRPISSLLSNLAFAVCAAVSVAGALLAAIAMARALRVLGVVGVVAGTAALLALLSAGFAAAVELVAGLAAALLIGLAPGLPAAERRPPEWRRQVAAVAAAAIFGALAAGVWLGGLASGSYPGGAINTAAVGRLLFDRDGLAGLAVGGMLRAGRAGAAASWRTRRR